MTCLSLSCLSVCAVALPTRAHDSAKAQGLRFRIERPNRRQVNGTGFALALGFRVRKKCNGRGGILVSVQSRVFVPAAIIAHALCGLGLSCGTQCSCRPKSRCLWTARSRSEPEPSPPVWATLAYCRPLHSIGRLGAGARPADNPRQLACAGSDATPWKRRQHAKVAKIEAQASSCHQAAQGLSVIKLGMEPSRPCPDLVPTITRLRRRRL